METTLKAVYITLQIAPLIALTLVMPYTVHCYLRDKSINVRRSTYIYIFVLYFICAYFMTMLPFPTKESLEALPPVSEYIQLIPFKNFFDIKAATVVRDVAILVFNVFLTVPLGFFSRFLFNFNFKKTVLAGFLTATLYEVTQITGIFFIYSRPYRFFDIDDFIINTLGAIIGYLLVPVLIRIIPRPEDSKRQLVQGSEVSFFHRCISMVIDFIIVFIVTTTVVVCIPDLRNFLTGDESLLRFPAFYFLFLLIGFAYAMFFRGGTLGNRITGLRLMKKGGRTAPRIATAMRSTVIYTSIFAIPFWVYFFMTVNTEYAGASSIIWVFLAALLMMCAAAVLLEMMFNAVTNGSSMFYDRMTGTYVVYANKATKPVFGIRVIDIRTLTGENIDIFSQEICDTLLSKGFSREAATKVRLMAEGVMLDWTGSGLDGTLCELRLDKRFRQSALLLSVPGENKINESITQSYVGMLSGMGLEFETYYAGEKNICKIQIPTEKTK